MNKKLLIGLSSIGIAAGFWACGDGAIDPMNEETDVFVDAMLTTLDFASQTEKAMTQCNDDPKCLDAMTKAAHGVVQLSSDSYETLPSSDGQAQPQSSSSYTFFNNSSMGPFGPVSSSSSEPPPIFVSSSSEALPAGTFGTCAPSSATSELNAAATWTFTWDTKGSGVGTTELLAATFTWTFGGEGASKTTDTGNKSSTLSYSKSGTKTASVEISTTQHGKQTIECKPSLRVNGEPITGCECAATNKSPDVFLGESAAWKISGCTSKANIIKYTWANATADETGLAATAPVAKKGDVVSGVTVTVENDDSSAVIINCPAVTAINSDIPDFKIEKTEDKVVFEKSGEFTLVADMPQGWHNSDQYCTVSCSGGNTAYTVDIDGVVLSGANYNSKSNALAVAHTVGKYPIPVKVTLGNNEPLTCQIGW